MNDLAIIKVPAYSFKLDRVFPEVAGAGPCSTSVAVNQTAALVLAICYIISGNRFTGALADLTPQEIERELIEGAMCLHTTLPRMFQWADSVRLDPTVTLTEEQMKSMPLRLEGPDFWLKKYQLRVAAWMARRMGCTAALGCGTGKTGTTTAAVIAAHRLGFIKESRCLISAPVNAIGSWEPYLKDLKNEFKVVDMISVDSLHHLLALPSDGGAVIFDEGHKLKNYGRDRTECAHRLRPRFEWAAVLTGSFLHTGCEAIMSMSDLACPGLSRFTDSMVFGNYFDAVVVKVIKGRGKRRELGIPAQSSYPKLSQYLLRSMISLSFESAEVKLETDLPPQAKFLIDTWEKPQWVRDLINAEWDEASKKDPQLTRENFDANCPIMWGPDLNWALFGAGLAFAEQFVREQEFIKIMSEFDKKTYVYPDDVAALAVDVRLRHAAIKKEIPEATEEALKEFTTRRKFIDEARKLPGLPSAAALFWICRTEGAVDRIVRRSVVDKKVIFRYVYAPGTSAENPGFGAKLLQLKQWLIENPDDSVFTGAAASESVDMIIKLAESMGVSYRVIRGGVLAKVRTEYVKEFQAGVFRMFIVQQVAGSESITCTKATVSFLIDHDISPITYTQYLARVARTGQIYETEHYDLSFTELQSERIAALRRGEEFDATIRRDTEAAIQAQIAALQNPV